MTTPTLNRRERAMAPLAQLEFHRRSALNISGVTRKDIVEILLQMAAYTGVPASMNGINAARKAFAAHPESQVTTEEMTHGSR